MVSETNGKTVLFGQVEGEPGVLESELQSRGFSTLGLSTVRLEDPDSWERFNQAAHELIAFDWVGFTSGRAVVQVARRLAILDIPVGDLLSRRLAAVGPTTSEQLRRIGRLPDLVPNEFSGVGMAHKFGDVNGQRILLPCAQAAAPDLPAILIANGAEVTEAPVYQVTGMPVADIVCQLTKYPPPDLLALTSGSSAAVLIPACLQAYGMVPTLVAIGPTTARAALRLGQVASQVARVHTVTGLASAVAECAHDGFS